MQKTHNKHVITGIILGLLVIIPAILLATNNVIKGKDAIAPPSRLATSSSSNHFYSAIGWIGAGENITISATRVDRLNRNINFTVDASRMVAPDGPPYWTVDHLQFCVLNITYPNGTKSFEISMIKKSFSIPIFYYNFVTNLSMPTGNYAIRAYPNNGSYWWGPGGVPFIGNFTFTPLSYVQVYNNNPMGFVTLNETTVYRNNTIGFNLTINDPETPYVQLTWNISLIQESTGKTMVNGTWKMGSAFNESYYFNFSHSVLGTYHFKVMVYDGQGGHYNNSDASPFVVKDNPPVIHAVHFSPPIIDGAPGILRVQTLSFTVNLTDVDNPWYWATVNVTFQRMDLNENFTSANFNANNATYNYTGFMNFTYNMPIANYSIIIEARDLDGGITYYKPTANSSIIVRDNAPVIYWVHINGHDLTNGLHLSTSELMAMEINASDTDRNLDYLEVRFANVLDKNDNITFNITLGSGPTFQVVKFNISTSILSTGLWTIIIIAHDFDGARDYAPMGTIAIDPDTRDITAFVIGAALLLIAGFVVGGMAVWRYANSKIKDIRRDMVIKGHGKADQAGGKVVEKKMPPKAGKKNKYQ